MQHTLRIGDTVTTFDDYFEIVRTWRVVEMRYFPEFDCMIPMVILVHEESIGDVGELAG